MDGVHSRHKLLESKHDIANVILHEGTFQLSKNFSKNGHNRQTFKRFASRKSGNQKTTNWVLKFSTEFWNYL